MTFLLLYILFQEPSGPSELVTFSPITAGNVVTFGSLSLTVPHGLFLATGDDVPIMIKLSKATNIPNCVGIFFSDSEDWSYCGVVQYISDQTFVLEPQVDEAFFLDVFRKQHLYTFHPFSGSAEFLMPPTYNKGNGSFAIGLNYQGLESNESGVFFKKFWVNGQDTIVLSIRVRSFDDFQKNEENVLSLLDIVSLGSPVEVEGEMKALSYFNLLSLKEPVPLSQMTEPLAAKGLSKQVIIVSVSLGIFGISLLLLVFFKSRASKATLEEEV